MKKVFCLLIGAFVSSIFVFQTAFAVTELEMTTTQQNGTASPDAYTMPPKPKIVPRENGWVYPYLYQKKCGDLSALCFIGPSPKRSEALQLGVTNRVLFKQINKNFKLLFKTKYLNVLPVLQLKLGKIGWDLPDKWPQTETEDFDGKKILEDIVPKRTQEVFMKKLETVVTAVSSLIEKQAEDKAKEKGKPFKGAQVKVEVVDEDGFAEQMANDNANSIDSDGKKKSKDEWKKEAKEEYNKEGQRAMTYTNSSMWSGEGENKVPLIKVKFFADKFAGLSNPKMLELIAHEFVHVKAYILWRNGLIKGNDPLMDHDSKEFKGEEKKFGEALKNLKK